MLVKSQKGQIESIENGMLYVISETDGTVLDVLVKNPDKYSVGQRIKMLVKELPDGTTQINVVENQYKNIKKSKLFINYSSLLNQINKTHAKLIDYLNSAETEDLAQDVIDDIRDKIEYLEKGKELFQK